MKIAVTYKDGAIFNHFGHCPDFKFYNISDGQVASVELVNIEPKGQIEVAKFLGAQGVTHLICGGLGTDARATLEQLNIYYFPKVKLSADDAVDAFLNDSLEYSLERGCCGGGKNHGCSCGKKQ